MTTHLVLPGPVVLAVLLLLFLLVLERSLPGPEVEVALPEVPHGELEQRVLAVVGDLGRADADVRHVSRVVGSPVPDVPGAAGAGVLVQAPAVLRQLVVLVAQLALPLLGDLPVGRDGSVGVGYPGNKYKIKFSGFSE